MKQKVRLGDGTICIPDETVKWMEVRKKSPIVNALRMLIDFEVDTLKGKAGDYLVKDGEGKLYSVKKEIFEKKYEIVKKEKGVVE